MDKKCIPKNLKFYGIPFNRYISPIPSYNSSTSYWWIKNPPKGLLYVYLKPRANPFNEKYPLGDYVNTLEDLLKYEIAIEEAFVFWDAKEIPQTIEPQIHLVVGEIFTDQNKKEKINDYLIKNNIIKKSIFIDLGCYNAIHSSDLNIPLPSKTFNYLSIDAIYFDDGMRIISPETLNSYTIEDLLKLSNGAKNIYLFSFLEKKRPVTIRLDDSLDPHQAIRDWKCKNNLFTSPPLIRENKTSIVTEDIIYSFKFGNKKFKFSTVVTAAAQSFETEHISYYVFCNNVSLKKQIIEDYFTKYENWINQYCIHPGSYSGEEVRNKLGCYSQTLYNVYGNTCYYNYITGRFFDNWGIDGNYFLTRFQIKYISNFLYTNKPPQKPKDLNLLITN